MLKNNITSIVGNRGHRLIDDAFSIFIKEFHDDQNKLIRIVPYRKTIRCLSEENVLKFSKTTINSLWFELGISEGEYPIYDQLLIDKINNYLQGYVHEHCGKIRRYINELIG